MSPKPKFDPETYRGNTPEEEAAIRAIIDAPNDLPLPGTEMKSAPVSDLNEEVTASIPLVRYKATERGRSKISIELYLDRDIVDRLRETGPGWRARAIAILRKAVMG